MAPVNRTVAGGVRWVGRVDLSDAARPRFSWSGSGFIARFTGASLIARVENGGGFIFKAVVDGVPQPAFTAAAGPGSYPLATALPPGAHTVELYRQTEGTQGESRLIGVEVGGGALLDPPPAPARLLEIVGDSISCGFGALGAPDDDGDCLASESHWHSYGAVAARALGAEVSTIAASGRGVVRNYAGDRLGTMPALHDRVLANAAAPLWGFATQPQAVVVNLGTNDVNGGKGDPGARFRDVYRTFLETIRARYADAHVTCLIAPLLDAGELRIIQPHIRAAIAARVQAGDARVELLDMPPQTPDKRGCSSHPNVAQHQLMADALVAWLKARLGW
jgi:lysophospholipase L1-like esterase